MIYSFHIKEKRREIAVIDDDLTTFNDKVDRAQLLLFLFLSLPFLRNFREIYRLMKIKFAIFTNDNNLMKIS